MCAGFGAVLNVVGMADGVQVDVQVVENPAMRADMPLKMATTSGYRIEGTADGKRYQEVWTSKRNDTVEREGLLTRVTGVMTGIRMEGIDDTRYGPPAPIDGQREVAYTLTARCVSMSSEGAFRDLVLELSRADGTVVVTARARVAPLADGSDGDKENA